MATYIEKLEELQKAAKEKFEEFDKQFGIKEKIEDGAKFAQDTFRETAKVAQEVAVKGAETIKSGADKIRNEVENDQTASQAKRVVETTAEKAKDFVSDTASFAQEKVVETAKKAQEVGEKLRDAKNPEEVFGVATETATEVINSTTEKAGEVFTIVSEKSSAAFQTATNVFNDTKATFEKAAGSASSAYNFGSSVSNALNSAYKTVASTAEWIQENSLQAASTGVSLLVGGGIGAGFTAIGSHWFFSSALPVFGVKKVSELFTDYLTNQEKLLADGELSEAEAETVKFERDIVKFVGAPLLGAFSFAAGTAMFAQIFNPRTITGAPISWLLGGNPILEGIWLFGNGVVCYKYGYDFFMIALDDHEDVQKIVKEIRVLLPDIQTK